MLGDKNWDEREGDSYKTIYSVRTDLVTVLDKKPRQFPILPGRGEMVLFFGILVKQRP